MAELIPLDGVDAAALERHVVICNINDKLGQVVDGVLRAGPPELRVVALVQDRTLFENIASWHPRSPAADHRFVAVEGCPTDADLLARVQIARARAAIILADPRHGEMADARSTLVAIAIERHSPQVHTVMELKSSLNQAHLRATEVNEVVCFGDLSEKLLAQCCITPGVNRIFERLLGHRSHDLDPTRLVTVALPKHLAGESYRRLVRRSIDEGWPCLLCGFVVDDGKGRTRPVVNPRADREPGRDSILDERCRLVVLAEGVLGPESLRPASS